MSGTPVFDTETVIKRIADLKREQKERPPVFGKFVYKFNDPKSRDFIIPGSIELARGYSDFIRIYREPKDNAAYVIGADTKGEGKDFYAASVIDNTTGERAAALKMQSSNSKPFAYQLYCLGKYYNDAHIAVEANFNTAPIEELERLGYANQYARTAYDDYTKKELKKYGFKTDGVTRPLIIDKEIDQINNHAEFFFDLDMLRECLTFVYDKNNRPDAIAGKHDDMLFADMIANEVRSSYPAFVNRAAKPRRDVESFIEYGS